MSHLVIVESPAKAKTIKNFLGDGFVVTSSIGHIRNLAKTGTDNLGVDIKDNFRPTYEIDKDKRKVIQDLKKQVKQASAIYLATDEDREGEAIAWHLYEVLGLKDKPTERIHFNEITKQAIQKAIEKPRSIDTNLVQAQQARQILDKIVGFKLSPILWRKLSGAKSAGRVQSPALRLVVERERQIQDFKPQSHLTIEITFEPIVKNLEDAQSFQAKTSLDFTSREQSEPLLQGLLDEKWKVLKVEKKDGTRRPSPPLTTSSLQQEASNRLGFSVKKTMTLAQNLYREGFISYMRTDSTQLSQHALDQAKQVIIQKYGSQNHQATQYKNQVKNAQEAHEAIRPTNLTQEHLSTLDEAHQKLYHLIWQRTLASQMKHAQIAKTQIEVVGEKSQLSLTAQGEVIVDKGFLLVYPNLKRENALPQLEQEQALKTLEGKASQTLSQPKGRYTEASLVKNLEKLGIGRPSTFASMVSVIQDRGYVEKSDKQGIEINVDTWQINFSQNELNFKKDIKAIGADKNKLHPTDVGMILSHFLENHFQTIVDYGFTARLEDDFDEIAQGRKNWQAMLAVFYQQFSQDLEKASELERSQIHQERVLGIDPKTQKQVSVRLGRFGPLAQMKGETDEKPLFASLTKNLNLQTITLEQALELFKLPRQLGVDDNGKPIKANRGRFGPFISYFDTQLNKDKFVSLKEHDPLEIDLNTAKLLIQAKKKADAEKVIKTFEGGNIQVLNGRFGPFITNGKPKGKGQINATVKKFFKDKEPQDLSLEDCQKALEEKAKSPSKGRAKRFRKS